MIKTPFKNRFRDQKTRGSGAGFLGRRGMAERRESGFRREHATVVHPWLSLPEKLAATQAAMQELAGSAAFLCPLSEAHRPTAASSAGDKPRASGVNIVFRKRRMPAAPIPEAATAS